MQLGKFWDNTTQNRSRKILDMFWHCRTKHVFKTREVLYSSVTYMEPLDTYRLCYDLLAGERWSTTIRMTPNKKWQVIHAQIETSFHHTTTHQLPARKTLFHSVLDQNLSTSQYLTNTKIEHSHLWGNTRSQRPPRCQVSWPVARQSWQTNTSTLM